MSTDNINQLAGNEEAIKNRLQTEPLLLTSDDKVSSEMISNTMMTYEDIMKKDSELSSELHDLTSLKKCSDLILEFNANWDYIELENCYYSLKNLRKTMKDEASTLFKQNIRLQQSLITYVDSLHVKLIEKIYQLLSQNFWKIGNDSILYRNKLEIDGVEFEYTSFIEFLNSEVILEQDGILDSNAWFISDISLGELQDTVRTKMNIILKDYIHYEVMIRKLKAVIFDTNLRFVYDSDLNSITWTEYTRDNNTINKVKSLETLSTFLKTEILNTNTTLVTKLGPLISKEFLKLVKKQISEILQDDKLSKDVTALNHAIGDLCNNIKNHNWHYDVSEIEELLNNKTVYNNFLLDQIFEEHLNKVRNMFNSSDTELNWKVLSEANLKPTTNKEVDKISENVSVAQFQPVTLKKGADDWEWDEEEDNGWDNEIDVGSLQSADKKGPNIEEKNDDDWDNAWDIDVDVDISGPAEKLKVQNENQIYITQIPESFKKILTSFNETCNNKIKKNIDEQYYTFKLNVLQTSLMAIAQPHYTGDWWQLFVDIRYITDTDHSLNRLKELNLRYIDCRLTMKKKEILKIISDVLSSLKVNENNKYFVKEINHLLEIIASEIIFPLSKIGGLEYEQFVIKFINFLFYDCILTPVSQWKIISEKNSTNISELISMVSTGLEVGPRIQDLPKYREMNEKFIITGKILRLHLKEIMDMFYDGEFYLFTTDEIIQWIILLFADTPLRKDAINDIKDIRKAQLEDD